MSISRLGVLSLFLAMVLSASAPCYAWLYDGGAPTISGPVVQEGSNTVWVCEPFVLARDSWVTRFGASVARGFGGPQMGFKAYLTDALFDDSMSALVSGLVIPTGITYTYRFVDLASPVRLDGGRVYYLTLVPNSGNFTGSVSWSYKPGAYYGLSTGDYGESWSMCARPLSVRVDGYAVPEADPWVVVVIGCAGLMVLRLSRKRCVSQAAAGRG